MLQGNNGNGKPNDPQRQISGPGHGADHGERDGVRGTHDEGEPIGGTDGPAGDIGERTRGTDGPTGDFGERTRGTDGPAGDIGERTRGTNGPAGDIGERTRGTDRPAADPNDETADDAADADETLSEDIDDEDDEDNEDDDTGNTFAAGRRWIRNIIILLLVAGLIGNAVELWSRLFNARTLPLLFQSRELSEREDVRRLTEAVVVVGTDRGRGSGFHVSDGYIITNYHVIEGAARTAVLFPGIGASFAADVAAYDPALDLAVLRVDSEGKPLPSIEIEREHGWEPGERVYVIGNPLSLTQIAVEGTIRGTMRVRGRLEPVMAVDAPIHEGNSGSPVINEHGRAIAVIYATAETESGGGTARVGLAVPLGEWESLLRVGRN